MRAAQALLRFVPLLLALSAGAAVAAQNPINDPQPGSSLQAASPVSQEKLETPPSPAKPRPGTWLPSGIDSLVPPVEQGVECPLPEVVNGAGQRMKELVENLRRFNALEKVDHTKVDALGSRGAVETRTFDYDVNITLSSSGVFNLEEYRNGSTNPLQFPALIATQGLPAMALVLHPIMISDFTLTCEGLGQWNGRPAWQIRFEQRADRPNRVRAYVINGRAYPVPLKGRIWLDPGTYQVQRLESELLNTLPLIKLTQERMVINYGPVQFRTHGDLWLPLNADVYWERRGRRYYRRHSFSNFKLFGVDTTQQTQLPKESYCFKNTSDRNIAGILTVSSVPEIPATPVSIEFTIPSGRKVCKLIGIGKDLNIPPEQVGPATFTHDGHASSIVAEVNLANTLELIPESKVAPLAH